MKNKKIYLVFKYQMEREERRGEQKGEFSMLLEKVFIGEIKV